LSQKFPRMILVISGTNREGSCSALVSAQVVEFIKDSSYAAEVELIDLVDLPSSAFSPKVYKEKPAEIQPFIDKVLSCDGMLVIVPEYNGSMPGALKYFIDLLPSPESFEDRPVAFIGIASGQWAGLRAVEHLQQVFGYRNAHIYPRRVFISAIHNKLDEHGQITDGDLVDRLQKQAQGFVDYCRKTISD